MRIQNFLDLSPLFSLSLAYDRLLRDFQRQLDSEEVHFLQALILVGIFFEERPVRPSELAATLQTSRSNLSHALRGLEKQEWIARSLLPGDARAFCFSLTKQGKKKVPRLIKIFDSSQERLEARGGQALNLQLKRFLEETQLSKKSVT